MNKKIIFPIIIILTMINIIISSFYFITITFDSQNYFDISNQLPKINDSLFPIFYPLLIRIVNFLVSNQFVASKLLSIILIFVLAIFFIRKKMVYEVLLIICLPFIQTILCYSWSETIFIPLLLIFTYYNYAFFKSQISVNKFILTNTILFALLFTTKYSAVSILFAQAMFIMYLYFIKNKKSIALLKSLVLSLVITIVYLSINYHFTGYLTGKRLSAANNNHHLSLYNFIYSFNPFFGRAFFGFIINYNFAAILSLICIIVEGYLIFKSKIWKDLVIQYILCLAFSFLLITVISYFFTRLDNLSIRLLMPFLVLFYFVVFNAIKKLNYKKFYTVLVLVLILLNISTVVISINFNLGSYR